MDPALDATHKRLRLALIAAAVACATVGLIQMGMLYAVFVGRAAFPLDLEWMEGGTLMHALRLAEGKSIYVEPSLEFIPFLYTPFYPWLLALLSHLTPLGYGVGRGTSILAFSATLGLLILLAIRQMEGYGGKNRLTALAIGSAAAGAVCASFTFTGAFYDLVRGDSLALLWQMLALWLAYEFDAWPAAGLAGLAIALAFFTKQTASLVGIAIGVGLLLANWRRGLVYGAVAAAALAVGIFVLDRGSEGWFWTYIFKLHQSHAFNRVLAFVTTPGRLFWFEWPALVGLAIATKGIYDAERAERRDFILLAAALGGIVSSAVGFGTQWAFDNAYIPGVVFPVTALAVFAARLGGLTVEAPRKRLTVLTLAGLVLLVVQAAKSGVPDRARFVPSETDRMAAQRFLDRLRDTPGDGFIPFHPYYSVLTTRKPFVHRMGVMDVAASYGRPRGLDDAILGQQFPWIILDWKSRPGEWPALERRYHVVHTFSDGVDAVRSFSGAETSPRYLLRPSHDPPPTPLRSLLVTGFETGRWDGFTTEGDAWGDGPVVTTDFGYGSFVADSGRGGLEKTGVLRSPPFMVDHAMLRLFVAGDGVPGLRLLLLVAGETAHEFVPRGKAEKVEWNLGKFRGKQAVLVAEDRAANGSLRFDDVVAFDPSPPAPR